MGSSVFSKTLCSMTFTGGIETGQITGLFKYMTAIKKYIYLKNFFLQQYQFSHISHGAHWPPQELPMLSLCPVRGGTLVFCT